MSANAQYILLLVVAVALTFVVGQLLIRAGEPFLFEVFQDRKVTRSVNLLLSVLFYLITLGVLAIISVLDIANLQDQPLQNFVVRLGIVLLVLGLAYGISMLVLIRVRQQRRADQISEEVQLKLADGGISTNPVSQPVHPVHPVQPVAPPNGL